MVVNDIADNAAAVVVVCFLCCCCCFFCAVVVAAILKVSIENFQLRPIRHLQQYSKYNLQGCIDGSLSVTV